MFRILSADHYCALPFSPFHFSGKEGNKGILFLLCLHRFWLQVFLHLDIRGEVWPIIPTEVHGVTEKTFHVVTVYIFAKY